MSPDELRTIVGSEEREALGYLGGALSEGRKKANAYYLGEPFGNEIDGRSQVVSTDVADTVEWILPSLMNVFTKGDDVVEFQPQCPEDEKGAKQASEYSNWVFQRDNPGFVVMHDMFKDALLNKLGICKVWWDPTPQYKTERYYDIPDDSFQFLVQAEESGEIEIVSDETKPDPTAAQMPMGGMSPAGATGAPPSVDNSMGSAPMAAPAAPMPSPASPEMAGPPSATAGGLLHDVVIKKTKMSGCTKIMAIPPEEFLIARYSRTVKDTRYAAHRTRRTQSSLIEDGYDEECVSALSAGEVDFSSEEASRNLDIEEQRIGSLGSPADTSTREIWVTEHYILADYDGDGIAERLKVVTGGSGTTTILTKDGKEDIEEWEGPIPFSVITPILMPHRVIGRSVADIIMDLQLIKSVIMRQALDNIYLSNDPRSVVNPETVELDDLLNSRPGGIIRTKGGAPAEGAVIPYETPFVAEASFGMLEYLDQVRENRTGVTKYNQGLDANSLNKTASGITQIMTAAQQRIELIARVFAETGIKHMFKLILYNVCKYQDKARMIRLRNEWVSMDPREWDEEMDVTINVGIGTGNRDQVLAHLALIGQAQNQIIVGQESGAINPPIVTATEVFHLAHKVAENAGFKNPEQFFSDPTTKQPNPPRPDPHMAKVQAEAQAKQQKMQGDMQMQQAKMQAEHQQAQQEAQLDMGKTQAEMALKQAQMQNEMALEIEKMKQEFALKQQELQMEMQLKREEMAGNMAMEREKLQTTAQVTREGNEAQADVAAKAAGVKRRGGKAKDSSDDVMDAVKTLSDSFTKAMGAHTAELTKTLARPRNVIRGADGKISGVQ